MDFTCYYGGSSLFLLTPRTEAAQVGGSPAQGGREATGRTGAPGPAGGAWRRRGACPTTLWPAWGAAATPSVSSIHLLTTPR